MSIREIAWLSGFRDSLYFSRVFKKTTGAAPQDWAYIHFNESYRSAVSFAGSFRIMTVDQFSVIKYIFEKQGFLPSFFCYTLFALFRGFFFFWGLYPSAYIEKC